MNLNKRQQLLAILAIVAVGLYVADKLVFTPLTNNWKNRSSRIAKLKERVRDGAETLKRETALREQWDRMRTNTVSSAKAEAESQMLKAFERWSQEGRVSVSSIRPQWKEAEEDYKTLECRADVAGNLSALARFLYVIERDRLGVKVDSLELTARNSEGSQLALVIQVSGLLLNPPKKTAK
jgi:F0F1-type ATP synthase membrane subunit b/b'